MTAKRPLSLAALIAAAILCLTAVLPASVSIADGVDSIVFTEEGDEWSAIAKYNRKIYCIGHQA